MMKTNKIKSIDTIYDETIESIRLSANNNGVIGVSTGLTDLDKIINGLQATFVYIIAGRPGQGKSSCMKSIARSCFETKSPCAIFSLEMSSTQMMKGLFSDLGDIHNQTIESGHLSHDEWGKIFKYKGQFNNLIFIDDKPSITIQYLESNVKRLVKEHGIKVIMIDYMQLMTLNKSDRFGRNREQEVAYLSSNIKRIAKQYNVAIIVLSQLSRACEDRKPPRPILSDLRESGSIESDAEVVIFIYRPAYYKLFTDGDGNDLSNVAELIVAKNRFGPTKSAYVTFIKEKTKFENRSEEPKKTIYSGGIQFGNDNEDVF
jgi:replicative DNA helicase